MSTELQPAQENAEGTPTGRLERIKSRFEWALEKRWPIALFQVLNGVYLFFLGRAYAEKADPAYIIMAAIIYVIIFAFGQYLLVETPKQIKERADRVAQQARAFLTKQMDIFSTAEKFLISRLRKMIEVLSTLQNAEPGAIRRVTTQNLSKQDLLNAALRDLCNSQTAIAAKTLQVPLQEALFRATFMEVQGTGSDEKLVYTAWHTWEDLPPQSLKKGITFRKGQGCAGIAWDRNKVVIEDAFKPGHEWQNNYEGQNQRYKSMISVPVRKGYGDADSIAGVITVDTQLPGYFGKKDDQQEEAKISAMIQPYGTYIAFVCVLDGAAAKFKETVEH